MPSNFVFSAATAAFQIEGANHTDGRTDSIWDVFCRVDAAVINGGDGSIACDHYHRYPHDVALMKRLGLDAYRFRCRGRGCARGRVWSPAGHCLLRLARRRAARRRDRPAADAVSLGPAPRA